VAAATAAAERARVIDFMLVRLLEPMRESAKPPIRTLFLCHQNRKRSATAERIFAKDPALDVRSAGTGPDALVRVNRRMLDWADIVFVMDDVQGRDLAVMFPGHPGLERVVCLNIPDRFEFLHPELVTLLEERALPHLERLKHADERA
jgi:predicted protein tyrosine phosphatase